MKRIYIDAPTIIGGVCYETSHVPQSAPDSVADYLVSIGNARYFETKIIEAIETKQEKKPLSASQPAPASQEPTVKKRGRPKQQ